MRHACPRDGFAEEVAKGGKTVGGPPRGWIPSWMGWSTARGATAARAPGAELQSRPQGAARDLPPGRGARGRSTHVATTQPVVKFTCEAYRTAPPDKRYELLLTPRAG